MKANDLWVPEIYTSHGFTKEDIVHNARALDVGCGGRKLPGATGMDILSLPGVDVVHDFNKTPWPFADDSFDLVFLNHALEHVDDVLRTLEEIHRIALSGGRVVIQVPYFRSTDAYTDPTHKHFFTSESLNYVIDGTSQALYKYSSAQFAQKGFWFGWPQPAANPVKKMLKSFVHSHTALYDQYLSLVLPTECLTWELEVIK